MMLDGDIVAAERNLVQIRAIGRLRKDNLQINHMII